MVRICKLLNTNSTLKLDRFDMIICAIVTIFSTVFSYLSIYRLQFFEPGRDSAIFTQSFWTATFQGLPFVNSLEGGSHFGIHFSPILYSLVPLYHFFPGPEFLLTIQCILISLGVIPIYLCAKQVLGKKNGFLIGVIYFLYPAVHGVVLGDFYEVAFAPLLIGLTLYGYVMGKPNLMLIFGLLSLLVKEDVTLIICMIGLMGLYKSRSEPLLDRWRYLLFIIIPLALLPLIFLVVKPFFLSADPTASSRFLVDYLNPVETLSSNNEDRAIYVVQLFAPVLFLPLLAPGILAISLPTFVELLFSPITYYFDLTWHYSALIIPIIFFSIILSLRKLCDSSFASIKFLSPYVPLLLIFTSIISTIIFSPVNMPLNVMASGDMERISPHLEILKETITLIPPDASVASQFNILPHLAKRSNIFPDYSHDADFILIDTVLTKHIEDFSDNVDDIWDNYDLIGNTDGIFLFQKKKL